eukprot:5716416-Prymnesium_polylepis.1
MSAVSCVARTSPPPAECTQRGGERVDDLQVEVVGRLVEEQHVWLQQRPARARRAFWPAESVRSSCPCRSASRPKRVSSPRTCMLARSPKPRPLRLSRYEIGVSILHPRNTHPSPRVSQACPMSHSALPRTSSRPVSLA